MPPLDSVPISVCIVDLIIHDILHNPFVREKYPVLYAEIHSEVKLGDMRTDNRISWYLSNAGYEEWVVYSTAIGCGF